MSDAIGGLSDADLQALRLAAQILRHKAALAARPAVERYCLTLGRAVDFELARRGIGVVVGPRPELTLAADADAEDRDLLARHLELIAGNAQLSPAVRDVCATLRERVAS